MMLSGQFQVVVCSDGDTAERLIASFRPDVMIMDLLLPNKDGITLLEDADAFRPEIILATTRNISKYTQLAAEFHGIDYVMRTPCPVRHIVRRLMELVAFKDLEPPKLQEPESRVTKHLHILGIAQHMDGYAQLQIGIPLFCKDRAQKLGKELYPEIARIGGYGSSISVERSIRAAIKAAWERHDGAIWHRYFHPDASGSVPCPSNKTFISTLAEIITLENSVS
jgi:CheY-like chemotaxis protein